MPRTSQDDSALSIVITSVKRFQETTLRSSFARSPIVLPSFSHRSPIIKGELMV